MTFIVWFAMLGAVLLVLALSSSYLRWAPVTTSVVCLGLGIALGSPALGLLQLELSKSSGWLEHLTNQEKGCSTKKHICCARVLVCD